IMPFSLLVSWILTDRHQVVNPFAKRHFAAVLGTGTPKRRRRLALRRLREDRMRSFGYWATTLLALIVLIFGIPIYLGGVWLISLGGSWYYAFAGIGLLVTAWFLFRHSLKAVWVYLATYAGTLIWALWEKGTDGWAQVPRL